MLRDQFLGKMEVEIGDPHDAIIEAPLYSLYLHALNPHLGTYIQITPGITDVIQVDNSCDVQPCGVAKRGIRCRRFHPQQELRYL